MSDLQILEIDLYFPRALVLSEKDFVQIKHKKLICTVEVIHFGNRGINAEKGKRGIVRSLRVLFIKDAETLDWMDWPSFLPRVAGKEKKMVGIVQRVLTNEVIKGLGLTPETVIPRLIVPRDILIEVI